MKGTIKHSWRKAEIFKRRRLGLSWSKFWQSLTSEQQEEMTNRSIEFAREQFLKAKKEMGNDRKS